ncbi:MAG: T9SS type A sorting domain-containing protein, partial [Bacteroidales bacterium]|nr:T9SS type A sorting domain-containing protein [Candidatus Latescibacterota bacterium]
MADHYPPWFRWVKPETDSSARVFWCERMDPATAVDLSLYRAYRTDDITSELTIQSISLEPDNLQVIVGFLETIGSGTGYVLEADGVRDEFGNAVYMEKMSFGNGPDLEFTSILRSPTRLEDGTEPVTVTYDVVNRGNESTPAFAVSIFFQAGDGGDQEEVLLETIYHDGLEPDETAHHSTPVMIPPGASRENDIIARADVQGEVAEFDETNNETSIGLTSYVPKILSILDTPSDGGGWVDLIFEKARYDDDAVSYPVNYYEIFRLDEGAPQTAVETYLEITRGLIDSDLDHLSFSLHREQSTIRRPTPAEIHSGTVASVPAAGNIESIPAAYFLDDWTLVETVPAARQEQYATTVPTYGVVPDEAVWSTYFVRAVAGSGNDRYYYSWPDSGFSYDNAVGPAYTLDCFLASLEGEDVRVIWQLRGQEGVDRFEVRRSSGGEDFTSIEVEIKEPVEGSYMFLDKGVAPGKDHVYRVAIVSDGSEYLIFETEAVRTPAVELTLYQNRPNPFNPATEISYVLPAAGSVLLEVYDVAGRRIKTLVDGVQPPGRYSADWTGHNETGGRVASGVYFYRLRTGKKVLTRKMVLLR